MPSFTWVGKSAVENHDKQVPYRLLKCDPARSHGDPAAGNLLVQGDNLEALKALLPYYRGQVKCVYIDPPYNTGNEGWGYNDNVNSPEMRKWIGKAVGKEAEDLNRHDKWLCMMYPRLKLLKDFMSEDGVVFISIGDEEVAALRVMLDEMFNRPNFIASITWKKRNGPPNDKIVGSVHEYVLVYAKNQDRLRLNLMPRNTSSRERYKNTDGDERGPWVAGDISANAKGGRYVASLDYAIINPQTRQEHMPPEGACWRYSSERVRELMAEDRIYWGKSGRGRPKLKRFLSDVKNGQTAPTIWDDTDQNSHARNEIKSIFGTNNAFETPKPLELIERILSIGSESDSLILDSFAGSGTTAHAVLKMNAADGGSRRCILVEMEPEIATDVTAERLRRVIDGYGPADKPTPGTGGGFRYCTLGNPLTDENGDVHPDVSFSDLAHHVYFKETGRPLPRRPKGDCPHVGDFAGTAYFLLYNGVLGDKRPASGNVLTHAALDELIACPGWASAAERVVYGEANRLAGSSRLAAERVRFMQIPYDLNRQGEVA